MSANLLHIIESAIFAGNRSGDLCVHILKLLLGTLSCLLNVLATAFEVILLVSNLHNFTGCTLEILLQLLELSALLEEGLRCGTALIFEDLLSLEVSTFSTLHELVSVVLVAHLQVIEGVGKGLNLLFALADLAIELVTKALEFFLLLGSLNHEVSLGVFTISLDVARARLVTLNETFVFDSKVLNLLSSKLKLNSNLMALLLSSLLLALKNVFVHLNFFLTLIHGHLKLVLTVLKTINSISRHINGLSQVLDLKLHDVVLNEGLLLLMGDLTKINLSQLVNKIQFLNGVLEGVLLLNEFLNHTLNNSAFILELLV